MMDLRESINWFYINSPHPEELLLASPSAIILIKSPKLFLIESPSVYFCASLGEYNLLILSTYFRNMYKKFQYYWRRFFMLETNLNL